MEDRRLHDDERGMTLIEILLALLLFSMVTVILNSFLLMGASMYKRISIESQIRNQGDALYSRIISELQDAIYAENVAGAYEKEIRFVKRAENHEDYVDTYRMRIEGTPGSAYGLAVYNEADLSVPIKQFNLTTNFMIDIDQSKIVSDQQNIVHIKLVYNRADQDVVSKAEAPELVIETKVPLFRME